MRAIILLLTAAAALSGCGDDGTASGTAPVVNATPTPTPTATPTPTPTASYVGAVYAGANYVGNNSGFDFNGNYVVAFGRAADGRLTQLGYFETGGKGSGGVRDTKAPARLNPLIAEDSLLAVDHRFLLVVNAGSNTVTSFRINADFTLTRVSIADSGGTMPVSLAYRAGTVYVANADEDGVFDGPPNQSGNVVALRLDQATGQLTRIAGSARQLRGRPADLEVIADGAYLVASAVNAASPLLPQPTAAEVFTFRIGADGTLAAAPAGTGMSTSLNNAAGRNLPNAIGIETYAAGGRQFVIAAEARSVSAAGAPPADFTTLQTGSISTWEIVADGSLVARSQDVLLGSSFGAGPAQAGFLAYSPDYSTFWVATTAGATISGFGLRPDGTIAAGEMYVRGAAIDPASATPLAAADGYVDLAISPDHRWLYQLVGLKGRIDVYEIDTLVATNIARRQQVTSGLLTGDNLQGLVAVGPRTP